MRARAFVRLASRRQGRLGEDQVDALGEVISIDPRVVLERVERLGEPDGAFQVVAEDLEVDLAGARELGEIDLLRKLGQDAAIALDVRGAGLGREVVELVVEPVVSQPRRHQWLVAERRVEIRLEERGEPRILVPAFTGQRAPDRWHATRRHRQPETIPIHSRIAPTSSAGGRRRPIPQTDKPAPR